VREIRHHALVDDGLALPHRCSPAAVRVRTWAWRTCRGGIGWSAVCAGTSGRSRKAGSMLASLRCAFVVGRLIVTTPGVHTVADNAVLRCAPARKSMLVDNRLCESPGGGITVGRTPRLVVPHHVRPGRAAYFAICPRCAQWTANTSPARSTAWNRVTAGAGIEQWVFGRCD
jgi:hypothetical protein